MAWCCPSEIEEALWRAAEQRLPREAILPSSLTRAVIERSRRYTSERERLDAPFAAGREAQDLAARALFFTVADVPKASVPLAELGGRGLLPGAGEEVRVLDLGAGPGAMSLAALSRLRDRRLRVRAVDRDRAALGLLAGALPAAAEALAADASVEAEVADALSFDPGRGGWDLVFAGSLLNELPAEARLELVGRALDAIGENGAVILVEPALREVARALHELRDRVIERGMATVFAPCTRRLAPCPMRADPDDWCHEDRPAELPPRAARLAAATGLREGGLKFSYLVLRRGPEPLVDAPEGGAAAWRVVSRPKRQKGKRECFACGDPGRLRVRLLKRRRSEENRPFEAARRGDVLLFRETEDLAASDRVDRVDPAESG